MWIYVFLINKVNKVWCEHKNNSSVKFLPIHHFEHILSRCDCDRNELEYNFYGFSFQEYSNCMASYSIYVLEECWSF